MAEGAQLGLTSKTRRISDLPGPRGIPVLGNALQVKTETLHQTAEQWTQRYGETFRFRIASRQFVVMSNPEMVASVLRDRPDGFERTARLNATAREMGFVGLFAANGEDWKRHRPMVLRGLDPTHIKTFHPTLQKVTQRLRLRWERAARDDQAIDLQADLMRYTVDVTAGLAFGTDMNTLESDQEVIQSHLDKILPALFKRVLAPVPYWHWFKLPSDRELDRHLAALHTAVSGFIADTRQRLESRPELREHPSNLIEAMIVERDRPGSALTDSDLSGNVLTMLLAGEDTTANTLAWMIWLLHRNPDAMRRATSEAHSAMNSHGALGHEQLKQLDYIEACPRDDAAQAGRSAEHSAGHSRHGRRRGRAACRIPGVVPDAAGITRLEPLSEPSRLSPGALVGGHRNRVGQLSQESVHAVRCRTPDVPWPLPCLVRDQDGGGNAAQSVHHSRRRHGRWIGSAGASVVDDGPGRSEVAIAGSG